MTNGNDWHAKATKEYWEGYARKCEVNIVQIKKDARELSYRYYASLIINFLTLVLYVLYYMR